MTAVLAEETKVSGEQSGVTYRQPHTRSQHGRRQVTRQQEQCRGRPISGKMDCETVYCTSRLRRRICSPLSSGPLHANRNIIGARGNKRQSDLIKSRLRRPKLLSIPCRSWLSRPSIICTSSTSGHCGSVFKMQGCLSLGEIYSPMRIFPIFIRVWKTHNGRIIYPILWTTSSSHGSVEK